MNTTNTTEFAATIGLDWADRKHDLWICPARPAKAEHRRLDQTPEALHEWVAKLRERFPSRRVAIAVETSRGPVISALMAYDFTVLFPVNPKALKDYRAAFCVSGAKDDHTDAMLLEELVRLHRDKLNALQPDTELTRKLADLVENRRHLVDLQLIAVNLLGYDLIGLNATGRNHHLSKLIAHHDSERQEKQWIHNPAFAGRHHGILRSTRLS